MSMAMCGCDTGARTRPNCPGTMNRSGFCATARTRIVPEERSNRLSTKSMVPRRAHVFSSASCTKTGIGLSLADFTSPDSAPIYAAQSFATVVAE